MITISAKIYEYFAKHIEETPNCEISTICNNIEYCGSFQSAEHFANEPNCISGRIRVDVVPLWWEISTYNEDGEPLVNNFSINELKKYINI